MNKFAKLTEGRRIWAIAAVHGEAHKLSVLHRALAESYRPGDMVVYTGNLMGVGPDVRGTIDEMLYFRRALIASPGAGENDVVFLRGVQEELWSKMLQLQFAPNPGEVLRWMLDHGAGSTITAYGGNPDEAMHIVKNGSVAISRWIQNLRDNYAACDGHREYMSDLSHAAYDEQRRLLFVHSGIDHRLPPEEQGDRFWWGSVAPFEQLNPYAYFQLVVRGTAKKTNGRPSFGAHYITLDAGCGFGGPLVATLFDENHQPCHVIEA